MDAAEGRVHAELLVAFLQQPQHLVGGEGGLGRRVGRPGRAGRHGRGGGDGAGSHAADERAPAPGGVAAVWEGTTAAAEVFSHGTSSSAKR